MPAKSIPHASKEWELLDMHGENAALDTVSTSKQLNATFNVCLPTSFVLQSLLVFLSKHLDALVCGKDVVLKRS